jgi:UDP-glucose 4-epimerase
MIAKARAYGDTKTIYCGTRYGNVMGSRGSVIPLFIEQILKGEPLTVTDSEMTRFIMTIDGAIDLVNYAFLNGRPGDIFVQKAPAATLDTLTRALLKIFGGKNGVRVIGTRHGEKLYETLLNREEMANADDLGEYYRVPADCRDMNYSCFFTEGERKISSQVEFNSHNTRRLEVDELIEILLRLDIIRESLRTGKIEN